MKKNDIILETELDERKQTPVFKLELILKQIYTRITTFNWILLFILILFSTLSLMNLDHRGFWLDEALTWSYSNLGWIDLVSNFFYRANHPPFYFLLVKLWRFFFGVTEISFRFLSFIFAFLSLIVVYQIGFKYLSKNIALFSTLTLAVNPYFIYYAREARMYSLYILLTVLSVYLLFETYNDSTILNSFFYCISCSLLMYTHYYGIAIVGMQIIISFFFLSITRTKNDKTDRTNYQITLLSQMISFILFVPWIIAILSNFKTSGAAIKNIKIWDTFYKTLQYYFYQNIIGVTIALCGLCIGLTLFLVTSVKLKKPDYHQIPKIQFESLKDRNFIGIFIIAISVLIIPFLISWSKLIFGLSFFHYRYPMGTLPLFTLCFFYGIEILFNKIIQPYLFVKCVKKNINYQRYIPIIFTLFTVFSCVFVSESLIDQYTMEGHGYREAIKHIKSNYDENDMIITESEYIDVSVYYYLKKDTHIPVIPLRFDESNAEKSISLIISYLNHSNIWYIKAHSRDTKNFILNWVTENNYSKSVITKYYVKLYYFSKSSE